MKTTILPMKSKGVILMFNIHEQLISVAMNIPAVIVYKLFVTIVVCFVLIKYCLEKDPNIISLIPQHSCGRFSM